MKGTTREFAYYTKANFRDQWGTRTATVFGPHGLTEVVLGPSYRKPGYQHVTFETVVGGRQYWYTEDRPPSRCLSERGAAMLARKWHATLATEGGGS